MTREIDAREAGLHGYIEGARWFGGKGRGFTIEGVRTLPHGIHLIDIAYDDGAGSDTSRDCYQLPLSSYDEPQDRISHALVGVWDGQHHYDAVHDREAMAEWLATFDAAASAPQGDDVVFHRVPGHDLDLEATSSLFSGEQSNSSVAFGEDSLMKVFRRVTPGVNPDIEIHRVLTEAGSENVAQLFGWIDAPAEGEQSEPLQLAMLQQFLRTATEGWGFALTSVRNLFAEADLHPEEVGGDFAGESHRLGVAVAEVHAVLREHFPTGDLDVARTAAGMTDRLDVTLAIAPDLETVAGPARAAYQRLAELPSGVLSQRIHGDLHLGQTLRSSRGWKLVDFEGEPAKPLAERKLPDSPWRDVAGMLRSFDYAARTILKDLEVDDDTRAQLTYRADEWVLRNREAFLEGYAGVAHEDSEQPALTADEQVLVAAYELDKAVYEVGYELRNRPDWVDIPMSALARAADEQGR